MSELLVLGLKLAFLALLWLFVLFAGAIIRTDLFGHKVRPADAAAASGFSAQPAKKQRKARRGRRRPTKLRITKGKQAGLVMNLGDLLKIGRTADCQLVLDDDYVSSRHARIYATDQGYMVDDLGSTNGTYLNDQRLTAPTPFGLGDTLRIGRTLMIVEP